MPSGGGPGYFLGMENASVSRGLKLLLVVFAGAMLEGLGGTHYLWVFPLAFPGFGLWLLCAAADAFLARLDWERGPRARLLLWCGGLLYFCARGGFPLTGVALILAPAVFWILSREGGNALLRVGGAVLLLLLFLGHDDRFFHWSLASSALNWRFSVHLLALFGFFRLCSWLVAVQGRGERPGFLPTMEYFLAPAFWLSPLHASHLVWERMKTEQKEEGEVFYWLARGLFHALLVSLVAHFSLPWLSGLFVAGGAKAVAWYEWLALGPVIFLLAYLDKSQVSYLAAGFLTLGGKKIEPDFRSPWLAVNLLDYWRRFHYWLWEFYLSVLYPPILARLGRWCKPERALPLAIVTAFTLGTGAGHYVSYSAGLLASFSLALIFGLATLLHYFARPLLNSPRVGIPVTWLTVFLLYILAYPVFGLGWGWSEWIAFFRS